MEVRDATRHKPMFYFMRYWLVSNGILSYFLESLNITGSCAKQIFLITAHFMALKQFDFDAMLMGLRQKKDFLVHVPPKKNSHPSSCRLDRTFFRSREAEKITCTERVKTSSHLGMVTATFERQPLQSVKEKTLRSRVDDHRYHRKTTGV